MKTDQDWTHIWPTATTFKWSTVPFPVRQGFVKVILIVFGNITACDARSFNINAKNEISCKRCRSSTKYWIYDYYMTKCLQNNYSLNDNMHIRILQSYNKNIGGWHGERVCVDRPTPWPILQFSEQYDRRFLKTV